MEGSSSSSSLSSTDTSLISFHDISARTAGVDTVKLLCSYGGRILPRYPDGKLRYVGGYTRVLPIQRSIPFAGLQVKLAELCGYGPVSIRCQLPDEQLDDTLVSVTSSEDLANLLEEYDLLATTTVKIRAFLFPMARRLRACLPALANSSTAARPPIHPSVRPVCASLQNLNPKGPVGELRGRRHAPVASYRSPRAHHQYLVHHGNRL